MISFQRKNVETKLRTSYNELYQNRVLRLVRTQNFPKKKHFLPPPPPPSPDTRMYLCVSGGKKCCFFGKFCIRTKWMKPYRASISTKETSIVKFFYCVCERLSLIFHRKYYHCLDERISGQMFFRKLATVGSC